MKALRQPKLISLKLGQQQLRTTMDKKGVKYIIPQIKAPVHKCEQALFLSACGSDQEPATTIFSIKIEPVCLVPRTSLSAPIATI